MEFPSPGDWQKEEEFCWLIRGPVGLTGGLWKTRTLPMRSEGMAVCLQSGVEMADWNHEVGWLVSHESTSTAHIPAWPEWMLQHWSSSHCSSTLEGWLWWPWNPVAAQTPSSIWAEGGSLAVHRQCIRSRHISDTGPITTPSELTLVKYPVSPSCSSTGPLGDEGTGVLSGKSTHLKGTESAWAWTLGLGFQNLGLDPAPNRDVTVTEQRKPYLTSCYCLQFSSVAQSCPSLCDPMDCSTPGFPVHHQLLELTQIHVHRVGDANQPSHPLSFPSPPILKSFLTSGSFPVKKGYCLSPSFFRPTSNQGANCQHSLRTGMACVHIKSSSPHKATEHTQVL